MSFLYLHQWIFTLYPFDRRRQANRGTKKAYQRWETCVAEFQLRARPALELLYSQKYNNEDVNKKTKSFARLALETSIENIIKYSELPLKSVVYIISQLASSEILIGFTEKNIGISKLELFYNDLELNGNEDYVHTWEKFLRFHQKLENEKFDDWRKKLDTFTQNNYMSFNLEEKLLCMFNSFSFVFR